MTIQAQKLDCRPLTAAEFEALPMGIQVLLCEFAARLEVAKLFGNEREYARAAGYMDGGYGAARKWLARMEAIALLQRCSLKTAPARRGFKAWLLRVLRGAR